MKIQSLSAQALTPIIYSKGQKDSNFAEKCLKWALTDCGQNMKGKIN